MVYQAKHFAFILHTPSKNKCLLWPGFYEDNQEEIDKGFVETDQDITSIIGLNAFLQKEQPYKVFIKKTKHK
jgi:hypothetical protein